ncbi:PREDICTED: cerberus [Gekko japonicus]|uniref:Cerberus n=1 Tax=Gekko japonicus TaxID=146911 RepID=A0ABM1L4L4_GEKJA|nr:PREDICTED: cerberus [Gekko japonicus]
MLLLLIQMLWISCLGRREQTEELQKKRGEIIPDLLSQDLLMEDVADNEGALELGLFGANPMAETMSKKQRPNVVLPYVDATQDVGSWTPTRESPHSQDAKIPSSHPRSKREAESTFRKDAKRFWDLFMLKTKSRSEEVVLPIKTNEMYEETCSTLPFSQSIVYENCETVVVQNNLCFGKCSSFHVPGPEDRLYSFCSHCLPTKFSMRRLQMNCTRAAPLFKVVMIVEECKCEVQKIKDPEIGFLHSDVHANVYGHN